jgi:hypothetical protein
MNDLRSSEAELVGNWVREPDGSIRSDHVEERIQWLIARRLIKIASDQSGWDTLYDDPTDGRLWELAFPSGELHGGGPRRLRVIDRSTAKAKYKITDAGRARLIVRDHLAITGRKPVLVCDLAEGAVRVGMHTGPIQVRGESRQLRVSGVEIGDIRATRDFWIGLTFDESLGINDLREALPVGIDLRLLSPSHAE